jgi:hypothetical protein
MSPGIDGGTEPASISVMDDTTDRAGADAGAVWPLSEKVNGLESARPPTPSSGVEVRSDIQIAPVSSLEARSRGRRATWRLNVQTGGRRP